jgi:hypothetical protein
MGNETLSEQWGNLNATTVSTRIRQSRNLRRMSLAEFDKRIEETIDAENDKCEREQSRPTRSYWKAAAVVLGVTTSWIVLGIPRTEDDIQASRMPL